MFCLLNMELCKDFLHFYIPQSSETNTGYIFGDKDCKLYLNTLIIEFNSYSLNTSWTRRNSKHWGFNSVCV